MSSSQDIAEILYSILPEDGSAIGNASALTQMRVHVPDLSEEDYAAARDALVASGRGVKGRGRGGSIARAVDDDLEDEESANGDEDAEDEDEDEFALESAEEPAARQRKSAKGKRKSSRANGPVQVVSYRHHNKRSNNPEVGIVHPENDPDQPKTTYAYDPHIDPALMFDTARTRIETVIDNALASGDVDTMKEALLELKRMQAPYLNWAGKAERTSFEIDTVSLHVHERVDPATILANARKRLKGEKAGEVWRQADLFAAPFENLPLRQAVDFYRHEKGWSNRLIAGDSLLVMNSLLQKESMAGKVQMIYIDPPYGIKYGSNFQPFTNKRDVKDGADDDLTQEPEMIKAFRDTWELGIHSYLTYLRDRLLLARELLHESGSVFVQISDENLHYIRSMMEEIFGPDRFVAIVPFRKKLMPLGARTLEQMSDFLIWFCKDPSQIKYRHIYRETLPDAKGRWTGTVDDTGNLRRLTKDQRQELRDGIAPKNIFGTISQWAPSFSEEGVFPFELHGETYKPTGGQCWVASSEKMDRLRFANRLFVEGDFPRFVSPHTDYPYAKITSPWYDTAPASGKTYVVQTNENVIERCMVMCTDPGDLVLDPTCGSGTTAFVAEKWGRRWITCDTSRVAVTLAKQRLMTGSFDYHRLRYPHEGLSGGFVYKTVPHITLKSIANNPDIDTIYEAKHPAIASALAELNTALKGHKLRYRSPQGGRKGEWIDFSGSGKTHKLANGEAAAADALLEWEVPFDWPEDWPQAAAEPFKAFHSARQAMQAAMDASIEAHAEQETLYDKPEPDETRLRITGPFSVEAVPAPTVLSLDDSTPPVEADSSVARSGETSRQALWRGELLKTGIRGKGSAMLKFTELEAIPGCRHLHASGSLETGERAVVSFGPEHAALEQKQVERAIQEAQTLVPRPKIVAFCAFTFDPEAAKDIDEMTWPGVTLLKAQMNTDLLTEDLKKARSSNQSFWLMGQPDVDLRREGDEWRVEVNGFDYFDPRSGELVSGGKSKIAMWSLDTDYDGRSLMPNQVFFPMAGAKDGWNRLRKTIRAELDEDLLEQFHGTVSLPFKAGENRRVAVKIIDDRGIESLKIMGLE
ncbi:MAG: site-specific DNA-methyltransferase [Roseomonas sp.]|nr:site-specific DNA-methyltransferase [Roseomonas sp.]MCA3291652.1 site-specific DNA-methyltransferase [Roseomonas sp.]MCA3293966.1 site-specific DNA-methyltransferase [Roseomonas sp.]